MKIRKAGVLDIDRMNELGKQAWEEGILANTSYNDEKVVVALFKMQKNQGFIQLVAEEDEEIWGGIVAVVNQEWWTDDLVSQMMILFMHPSKRRGRVAIDLIKEYIKVSKEMGAKMILVGNTTGVNTEGVEKLYESLGFSRMGGNYVMTGE